MKRVLLLNVLFFSILGQCFSQADSLLLLLKSSQASPHHIDEIQADFNKTYYQNPPASLKLAMTTDSLVQKLGYKEKLGITKLMLGIAHNINEEYDDAVEAFLASVDHAESLESHKTEAQAYNGLAVVWQVRKDTETSAQYFEKALELYKSINDTLWTGLINLNLGGLYMEDEHLEKADQYLVDAIIAMDNMKQPVYAGYGKLNLGSLRVKQKRYDEAIPYLEEALTVVPFQVNPLIHAVGNSALGEAYFRKNQPSRCKQYLDLALEQSKQVKNYEQLEVVNGLLSEYYESVGNNSQALAFYKEASALRDSFITKEEDERLIDALKKYEAEKNQQEIMLLSAENESKDLRNKRDRRNLLLAILGLLALAVITVMILFNRNRFRRLNHQLELQKSTISENLAEKELLLREIHHRVKNNLQVISSLLSLQSNYVKSDSAIQALNLGRDRVKSMGLIHQNLYQEGNLTGVKLKPYFENLCRNLYDSYAIDREKIKLDLEIEDIDLEVDHVIPLGLIANELISNSLKHAFRDQTSGVLRVALREQEGKIHFSVEDNGIGANPEMLYKRKDSFGYKMIHAFKDKLDAKMLIKNEGGLRILLTFAT